jgi:cell division protein FtsW
VRTAPGTPPPHGGLLIATATLAAFGLVMVYSATAPLSVGRSVPPHFLRQLGGVLLGSVVAFGAARVPLATWRRLALPLWLASVALLVLTLVAGERVNGARRWLALPGAGLIFQPSEFAKWATLMAAAAVLSARDGAARVRGTRLPVETGVAIGLAAVPALLILLEPDTGSAALLLGLVAILLFVAGTPLRAFLVPAALGAAALAAAVVWRPYALHRIRAFLDPWATANNEGFQIVQSFVAFGRGGLLGVDLGDGRQKLFYLPEAHTDFVLSVVAEELGLVGVALVLGAFAALLFGGCQVALRARSRFGLLVAFGMTASIAVPAALNAAVVMGLVPPTGLTLPFVSYGRTSLLISFLAVGVLIGLSRGDAAPRPRPVGGAEPRRFWRSGGMP